MQQEQSCCGLRSTRANTPRRYLAKAEHQFLISNGRFRPVFNDEMEKALADYLLELSRRFFGMTTNQVRSLAFEFAEWNGLPHNFDRDLKMAGVDWLAGFRERHKNTLALRSPEMTSLGRIQVFNEVQTRQFFTLLGDLYKNHKFLPMYNVDETGVPTVPTKLPKVLSAKGAKRVAKVVSSERGKTVTLVCSMNAAGNFIPSAYVFRRKTYAECCCMQHDFLDSAPPESLGIAQMTQDLFPHYLGHFHKHTRASTDDPVLLISDKHASHLSIAAIEY